MRVHLAWLFTLICAWTGRGAHPSDANIYFVAPAPGTTIAAGSSVRLTAYLDDSWHGAFNRIEFHANGVLLGTGSKSEFTPGDIDVIYHFTWNNPAAGDHLMVATATSSGGLKRKTSAVKLHITPMQTPGAVLEFLQPRDGFVYSSRDEIPVILRGMMPSDIISSVEILAGGNPIGIGMSCCPFCPCPRPQEGVEATFQIPTPWDGGVIPQRMWQGWKNATPGTYRLTARATGEMGGYVEAQEVTITVVDAVELDLRLRVSPMDGGAFQFVLPSGSLVSGGFALETSFDLKVWKYVGDFSPGNVATFFTLTPPNDGRAERYYRAVRVFPSL